MFGFGQDLTEMELKDQVCSFELAKRLKELGVKQESLFGWAVWQDELSLKSRYKIFLMDHLIGDKVTSQVSAFTVAELGEMLPWKYRFPAKHKHKPTIGTGEETFDEWTVFVHEKEITAKSEADARAKMLIYLIEHEFVKP